MVILTPKENSPYMGDRGEDCSSDCDCGSYYACSSPERVIDCMENNDLERINLNEYCITPATQEITLNDSYKMFFGPHHKPVVVIDAGGDIIDLLKVGGDASLIIDDPELYTVFLRLINCGLLINKNKNSSHSEEMISLTAWMHMTDRCNLRCHYCYLPHVREDMSYEIGVQCVDAIFRSAKSNNLNHIKLKYAGGEPLLNFPIINKVHRYAKMVAQNNNISLNGVVLSNGTLLTEIIIEQMKELQLRLMISVDGIGEVHDLHRPYAGNKGSFTDVKKAIQMALNLDLKPHLSVTISSRTVEYLDELLSWIVSMDLPFNLNFYRENELSASFTDMQMDEEKIIQGMLSAYEIIKSNLPKRSLLSSLVDKGDLSHSHLRTCGVGQNYLVFDQNGMVSKCQMLISKPITNNKVFDPLKVVREDKSNLQNLPVLEKDVCKSCEWKFWCAGGCSLSTYRATKSYNLNSPNCKIYKAIYPEAVKLEGFRIIYYANDLDVVDS